MMTRWIRERLERVGQKALWLAAALTACESTSAESMTSSDAPAASTQDSAVRSVCPHCIAGGETTDFAGDLACATGSITPVERESALAREFGIDAMMSRLAEPLRTSFGWRRGVGGSVVIGYERETEVEFRVEILGLAYGEFRDVVDESFCGDYLRLDARVQLATADGALSGTFERPFRVVRGSDEAYLMAQGIEDSAPPVDLRDFSGALDLKLDAERGHAGHVGGSLSVGPDGLHGELYIFIQYMDQNGVPYDEFTPMRAQWPSDGCDAEYVRVDADAAINPADGRTARHYWEQHQGNLDAAYPTTATWLDGSSTQVDLELGAIEAACLSRTGAHGYVSAPLRTSSNDGRLIITHLARAGFRTDEDTVDLVTVDGEPLARAAFAEQLSVTELDWADDYEAHFELYSSNPPDSAPSGDLNIIGFDGKGHNRLYLHWCSGGDCDGFPRPEDRY